MILLEDLGPGGSPASASYSLHEVGTWTKRFLTRNSAASKGHHVLKERLAGEFERAVFGFRLQLETKEL